MNSEQYTAGAFFKSSFSILLNVTKFFLPTFVWQSGYYCNFKPFIILYIIVIRDDLKK